MGSRFQISLPRSLLSLFCIGVLEARHVTLACHSLQLVHAQASHLDLQHSFFRKTPLAMVLGNENSARSFSDRSFFEPPWGHGRPRLWVMDVRTEMLVF